MTIWKSTLQGFLEEAVGPVYVIAVAERSTATLGNGTMEMTTFLVYLTGFNQENRPLGLRLPRPAVPSVFQTDVEREHQANLGVLREVRSRLEKLSRPYRDGILSDKAVAGELD
jgi:hypothetical protein